MKNIKIENFADFSGCNLKLSDVIDYIYNLSLDEIELNEFNDFEFKKYNETVRVFVYEDFYKRLKINIDEVF